MVQSTLVNNLMAKDIFKVKLMEYDKFIKEEGLPEVTSTMTFEPNSRVFHKEGLFSESIYGSITDTNRFTSLAYIDLKVNIIHPVVYKEIILGSQLYKKILNRKVYALFNTATNDFETSTEDHPKSGTGFTFFCKYLPRLANRDLPESLSSRNNYLLIKKYKDNLFTSKFLTLPAGMRDMDLSSDSYKKDAINSDYSSLISYTSGLPKGDTLDDVLFDDIKLRIQNKVNDIYTYLIYEFSKGKSGFNEGHLTSRKVAMGTRNVITASLYEGTDIDNCITIKPTETMVSLLNTIKSFQPFFNKYIRKDLFGEVISDSTTLSLIDPKTKDLKYIEVGEKTIYDLKDIDKIDRLINKFKHVGFRNSPVSIKGLDKKEYYLLLKYIDGKKIYIGRSKDDLEQQCPNLDTKSIEPMRWCDVLYIAAVDICKGRHVFITRYPIDNEESNYPSSIIPSSTINSTTLDLYDGETFVMRLPRFPTEGRYHESVSVSSVKLAGMGGDHDGDTVNVIGVWDNKANQECSEYLDSVGSIINTEMRLKYRVDLDVTTALLHCVTSNM